MKIAFNVFYGVFIGLLVFIGVLFLISITPIELGIETKLVQSGSMEPAIPIGALVIIKPNEVYQVGDVITFGEDTDSAVPTTHRIVGVREADGAVFYTTKGDANEEQDAREVTQRDVIGKVYVSVPYAGFVLNFARQPLGFALLIALPAALVILAEFAAIVQEVGALWRRRGAVLKHPRRTIRSARTRKQYSVEYVRLFETDDVFIPVRILDARATSAGHRQGTLSSTLAVLSLVVLTWYGTSSTLSFFRDTETSTGNTFAAGTWDGGTQLLESLAETLIEAAVLSEDSLPLVEEVVEEANESEPIASPEEQENNTPVAEEESRAREEREDRDVREERDDDAASLDGEENVAEETITTSEQEPVQEESTSDPAPEATATEPAPEETQS